MNRLRNLSFFAVVFLLSACGTLPLTQPKSLTDKIAYAAGTFSPALRDSTSKSLDAHAIGSDEAEYVLKITDESDKLLEGARILLKDGDVSSAAGRYRLAQGILDRLQTDLNERKP